MTISFLSGPVTVRAPATSANLGPGFDSLGLALSLVDEVTAQVTAEGVRVEVTGEGAGELPTDDRHLIVMAMRETFAQLGAQPSGLALRCLNRIPQARGMGSSSAAIVAGVVLADALAGGVLDQAEQLRIAARIEGHPDNVAPCLLGGFTIAWTEPDGAKAVSSPVVSGVRPTVFVPSMRGLTAVARAALPASVPHGDAAFNASRAALLVLALTAAPGLLLPATEDRLHQQYRASGMSASAELVRRLREAGIAAVVSGAGPSVLALSEVPSDFVAGDGWRVHRLMVSSSGADIVRSKVGDTNPDAD